MCGIVGYVGWRNATEVLLEGLKNLEYRGYDSAGIAVHLNSDEFFYVRAEGKLANLTRKIHESRPLGSSGIGHTRWATHGKPSERNAHPHSKEDVYVVHNGIIENYGVLKETLTKRGVEFRSETDTEVFAALLQQGLLKGKTCRDSLISALSEIKGSYAFAVLFSQSPEELWVARLGSPLIIGVGDAENLVASDIPALLAYTDRMLTLEDGEFARLSNRLVEVWRKNGEAVPPEEIQARVKKIPWTVSMAQKGGYKHFMLKEIFEQPLAIEQTLVGRIDADRSRLTLNELDTGLEAAYKELCILACGTSYHAGLVGEYYIERLAKLPTSVDYASEFRYREPIFDLSGGEKRLVVGISQSGETIDTLYALKTAKEQRVTTMAICNVMDSSIARSVHHALYTRAGPEIGVASTKAFTTQLALLLLLSVQLAIDRKTVDAATARRMLLHIADLPKLSERTLATYADIRNLAERYMHAHHIFFMGRGPLYPIALEGALKLKEISYIHAEGYAAGELKHGTIALIEEGTPVIALLGEEETYREKMLSNIEEVQARGAQVIAVAPDNVPSIPASVAHVIRYPAVPWYLEPLISVIPLQLFAYSIADLKGTDIDQPRNLAKSVTVE